MLIAKIQTLLIVHNVKEELIMLVVMLIVHPTAKTIVIVHTFSVKVNMKIYVKQQQPTILAQTEPSFDQNSWLTVFANLW